MIFLNNTTRAKASFDASPYRARAWRPWLSPPQLRREVSNHTIFSNSQNPLLLPIHRRHKKVIQGRMARLGRDVTRESINDPALFLENRRRQIFERNPNANVLRADVPHEAVIG